MKKTVFLLLSIVLAANLTGAQELNAGNPPALSDTLEFSNNFIPKTLRIDYMIAVNSKE